MIITHTTLRTKTGIHENVIAQMVKDMDLCDDKANIILLFDEMKLQSGLAFSSSIGKLMGCVDVGDINTELKMFQQEVESDGYSRSLKDMNNIHTPYGSQVIENLHCVNHILKRLGKNL